MDSVICGGTEDLVSDFVLTAPKILILAVFGRKGYFPLLSFLTWDVESVELC